MNSSLPSLVVRRCTSSGIYHPVIQTASRCGVATITPSSTDMRPLSQPNFSGTRILMNLKYFMILTILVRKHRRYSNVINFFQLTMSILHFHYVYRKSNEYSVRGTFSFTLLRFKFRVSNILCRWWSRSDHSGKLPTRVYWSSALIAYNLHKYLITSFSS